MPWPYRASAINTPALLRALADVTDMYSHHSTELTFNDLTEDMLDFIAEKRVSAPPAADALLSTRIAIDQPELRLAMGVAYRRHGGDPAAFLLPFEIDELNNEEVAS